MDDTQTSISQTDSPEAVGEFWDAHDLGEMWGQIGDAFFSVVTDD
jgi:hypothetical protein